MLPYDKNKIHYVGAIHESPVRLQMQHFLRARSFASLKDDARALCFFINVTFAWEREEQATALQVCTTTYILA